jgi:hypothetical protein
MPTKKEEDGEHPASHYLVVEDPDSPTTWHLRVKGPDGKPDHRLMGAAWAALHGGYRGNRYEGPNKEEAIRKLKALYRAEDMEIPEMADLDGKWIPIFEAGDYGEKGNWPVERLDELVRNYDPNLHEAPVVIGHPELDKPAFGWFEALRRVGNFLEGKLRQVHEGFETLLKEGRFKKRSVALYTDPVGKLPAPYLRHVGFLGAVPPEVKGLPDLAFVDGDFSEVEFDQEEKMDLKQIKETVAEFLREKFGGGEPARGAGLSDDQVKSVIQEAVKPFTEKITALETKLTEADKREEDRKKEAGKQAIASAVAAARTRVQQFIERLKPAGRWVPAFERLGLPALMEQLALAQGTVTFGEGDKKIEKALLEVFEQFLEALPPSIVLKEITPKGAKPGKVVAMTPSPGITLDEGSVALSARAREIAAERKITFGEALREARQEAAAGTATT